MKNGELVQGWMWRKSEKSGCKHSQNGDKISRTMSKYAGRYSPGPDYRTCLKYKFSLSVKSSDAMCARTSSPRRSLLFP